MLKEHIEVLEREAVYLDKKINRYLPGPAFKSMREPLKEQLKALRYAIDVLKRVEDKVSEIKREIKAKLPKKKSEYLYKNSGYENQTIQQPCFENIGHNKAITEIEKVIDKI